MKYLIALSVIGLVSLGIVALYEEGDVLLISDYFTVVIDGNRTPSLDPSD